MSVYYYVCANCGEVLTDYDEGTEWCKYGNKYCCEKCVEEVGYKKSFCNKYKVSGGNELDMCSYENCGNKNCSNCEHFKESSCSYCRNEKFEDGELLQYLLDKLNMSRERVVEEYRKYLEE